MIDLGLRRIILGLALGVALFGATVTLTPSHAMAQSQELLDALVRAQGFYDNLALSDAEKELEDALALADRLGLGESAEAAQLHLFLGIVRQPLGGDDATAAAFREALLIDRDVALPADYSTPGLNAILDRERAALPAEQPETPEVTPPEVVTPTLNHSPVSSGFGGEPIVFQVDVPATVPVYRVVLYFRRFGESTYKDVEMAPRGETSFAHTLTGDAVCSSQIDYYIEALDRTGNILASEGDRVAPMAVSILQGGKCKGGKVTTGPPPKEIDEPGERQYVFLQISPGTAAGLVLESSTPVVNPDASVAPGLATAPFHLMVELGFIITPELHMSATYRNQFVFLTDGVEVEPIFGGKLRWWFDNDGAFVMYTAVGGGFGHVRHLITVQLNDGGGQFVDTIKHGPGHAGAGFGFGLKASDNIAFILDVYPMLLFPEVSANLDLNLGLRVAF